MKNKFNVISIVFSIIYGLFTFNYIYNHNEYLDQALVKIMITGGILFSIFLIFIFIVIFIVLKFVLKIPKWDKKFSFLSLICFISFAIYSLFKIFYNSSSLKVAFTFGLEFVIDAMAPALLLFSMLLCFGSYLKN